jgi:hypothetical protein
MKNKIKTASRGKKEKQKSKPEAFPPNGQVLESVLEEITTQSGDEVLEQDVLVECPYCDESFEIKVSADDAGQVLYEDCQVCCRALTLHVHEEDGEFGIEVERA